MHAPTRSSALPGGLGTLEELLRGVGRAVARHARQADRRPRPDGTYAGLHALVDTLVGKAFVRPEARDAVQWARSVPEAFALLDQAWASGDLPPEPTPEEVLEAEP